MKTIVTFLIALLAFATTVAWAGPETGSNGQLPAPSSVQAPAHSGTSAKPAAGAASRGQAARSTHKPVRNPSPAANYEFELPAGPVVICACVVDKSLV